MLSRTGKAGACDAASRSGPPDTRRRRSKVLSDGGKRRPPNAGKGRKKGVPNKLTQDAKLAMEMAFAGIGGVSALTAWAKEQPTEFYKIWSRLIPKDVEVSGKDGGPIPVSVTIRWGSTEIPV